MGFLDVILSVASGGATGLLGSLISGGMALFEGAQKRKDKALEFAHELALLDRQAALADQNAENELAIVNAETAGAIREASYQHDMASGRPHKWVVDVLKLVRPTLTVLLVGLTWVIYLTTADLGIQAEVVSSVLFMTSSAGAWWFGDRRRPR